MPADWVAEITGILIRSGQVVPRILRLLDTCRTVGVLETLKLVPRWAVRPEFFVFLIDLRGPLPTVPAVEDARLSLLTEAEIPCVRQINPALSEAEMRRRLREGQECLLGWMGGSLAHYWWYATAPAYLPYLGKTFQPSGGDIFTVEIFTHPAFRRQGIFNWSVSLTSREAREKGFVRRLSMVAGWNAPAVRATRNVAGKVVGTVGYWNIGCWRHYVATGDVRLEGNYVSVRPRGEDIPGAHDRRR